MEQKQKYLVFDKFTECVAKKKAKIATITSTYGNYSPKLTKLFASIDILPGDRIKIDQGMKHVEGNLLAQNELGDPNTILIKLDNGYNIGIRTTKELTLEKLTGSVELESFQIKMSEQNESLPQISLLATGGTIASRIDYQTGGVVMAMQPEEIFASLPELFLEVSFKQVKSLFSMGSEDLSSVQWKVIAENVYKELDENARGVVISHGTDTMGYTSAILSFMVMNPTGPIVITGAQRSSDRGSFDGAINLMSAARIAANSKIATTMVCMHETTDDNACQLSRGTRVRKMHTSRRDAFRSINDTPLARISVDGKITELQKNLPRRNSATMKLSTSFDDNISLIKSYPGINPNILDFYIDKGIGGVIIEGTGLGHVPTFTPDNIKRSWMPSIQRAIDEEIFVGMTSQCIYGRVHPYVYKALRTTHKLGVSYLGDMLPETALMKLGWTLGNVSAIDEVKKTMETNLTGEIHSLSRFREFLN